MNDTYTYVQESKSKVRHESLFYSVDLLTTQRNLACCVERSYVRKIYDYFKSLEECKEQQETMKIRSKYINNWERLHDSCVGHKRPEDLVVAYLSGPEPQNDFDELLSLGILPQNIWAFENHSDTYSKALKSYDGHQFPQPKIVKVPIEQFFKYTPKKFDIVYIDACGSIPSSQHALRCVSSLCKYHRLNSPGIIITNFASPDIDNPIEFQVYKDMISLYLWVKEYPNDVASWKENDFVSSNLDGMKKSVELDFDKYYGEFISATIRDISSVLIPIQRFSNSVYLNNISNKINKRITIDTKIDSINSIKNNSLNKFLAISSWYNNNLQNSAIHKKIQLLLGEFSGLDGFPIGVHESFNIFSTLKSDSSDLNEDIEEIRNYFERGQDIYQFLDRPNSNLFFDLIVNQFAYPMHYNAERIRRYAYKAKHTKMFTDVLVLDECRYIYEWLPTIHQVKDAFTDLGWQYVFRFALDGLIKQRINYNNEYFFQGSVIGKNIEGFESKKITDRIYIERGGC